MVNRSIAVSEHKLLNRIQLRLIFLYLIAFLVFETAVIGFTYAILSHQIMTPMYQSVTEEWAQTTSEAVTQLSDYQEGETKVEVDTAPEVVANWLITPTGQVVSEHTTLTSATQVDLKPIALRLARQVVEGTAPTWTTTTVNHNYVLIGVKPLYKNGILVGSLISFRSLTIVHETMESLTHIDIEIGLIAILLTVPVTYWLAHRSMTPVRTAMQRQRNFVNDAAHELRTPLTILHGTLELAQVEQDVGAIQQAIREGIAETEYITELIANLSTLARMESGATELNVRQIDLADMTRDTLAALKPLADKLEVSLVSEGLTDSALMEGDATRLRQLLVVLVDNALKYTPAGGGVRVAVAKQRGHLELRVQDTGIGIPEEELPHIFDRFYRATFAENQAHGSGIGLAIAAWIVEAHHGQILVQSRQGKGTTFRIILPLQRHGVSWKKVLHPKG